MATEEFGRHNVMPIISTFLSKTISVTGNLRHRCGVYLALTEGSRPEVGNFGGK